MSTRSPEAARDNDRDRLLLDCYRLGREPKAFKDFQVLFSRDTARSRDRALRTNYFLAGLERGPLNEGSFVVDGKAHAIFFLKNSLESKTLRSDVIFAYIVLLLIYNRRLSLAYTSRSRSRILSTLP